MSLSEEEIEQLALINGHCDFDAFSRDVKRAGDIPGFLRGAVEEAWERCLPEWKAFGRVRDRSEAIRAPHYWPSFARNLGYGFVEQFRADYEFLFRRLDAYLIDTTEYLCTNDLVEFMLSEHAEGPPEVRERFFALPHPLSPVVKLECSYLSAQRHGQTASIGAYLRREYALNYEDADLPESTLTPEQLADLREYHQERERRRQAELDTASEAREPTEE